MNYTSVEQSKKLVELGINPNTADMYYTSLDNHNIPWVWNSKPLLEVNDIPCWSTGALINLLPKTITDRGDDDYNLFIDVTSEMPCYIWCEDYYYADFPNDFLGGDLISNLVKSIEWLKEHKYM